MQVSVVQFRPWAPNCLTAFVLIEARESKELLMAMGRKPAEIKDRKAQQASEGAKAMSDYVAEGHAVRAKTARLRELRLAKEAADKKAPKTATPSKKTAAPN